MVLLKRFVEKYQQIKSLAIPEALFFETYRCACENPQVTQGNKNGGSRNSPITILPWTNNVMWMCQDYKFYVIFYKDFQKSIYNVKPDRFQPDFPYPEIIRR